MIYVVVCGNYEDTHNELVTEDIEEDFYLALKNHDGEGY